MIEATEPASIQPRIEPGNRLSRRRAEKGDRFFHRLEDALHVSVRERRSQHSNDFPVARIVVTVHEPHRIAVEMTLLGKIRNETVQLMLEGHGIRGRATKSPNYEL